MRRLLLTLALMAGLAACASPPSHTPVDVLLLGEQHDAPDHQRRHRDTVAGLAERQQLAALAIEMAEQGRSTNGLARDADEAAVRAALGWQEEAWAWAPYAPAIMVAVRAGVPVLGANLPRVAMRAAMSDESLDGLLAPEALARQREAIRAGHCDLIPVQRLAPMARIQIARDRAMAQTLSQATRPGATAVLLAGSGHVDPELGVPRHLPPALNVRPVTWPAQASGRDHCAQLREQLAPRQP